MSKTKEVKAGFVAEFPVKDMRPDGGTQMRVLGVDKDVLAEYAEAMRGGATFAAVDLFYDARERAYWISDGHHRYWAAVDSKTKTLPVNIHIGGKLDAFIHALGANAGLPRTIEDKRHTIRRALANPEIADRSDRAMAHLCRVGRTLVGEVRKQLESEGKLSGQNGKRKGVDGKERDTAAIGAANKARAEGADGRQLAANGQLNECSHEHVRIDGGSSPAKTPPVRTTREGAQEAPAEEPVYRQDDVGEDLDEDAGDELEGYDPEEGGDVGAEAAGVPARPISVVPPRPAPIESPKAPPVQHRDAEGRVIPDGAMPAWGYVSPVREVAAALRGGRLQLTRTVESMREGGNQVVGPLYHAIQHLVQEIRALEVKIASAVPHAVCPFCKGTYSACPGCRGTGWVTEEDYRRAPEVLRKTDKLAGDIGHWLGESAGHNAACRSVA